MTRRRHPVVAVLLALLLVLMQQGAQLHALGHDNDRLQRPHDTGLQAPTGDSCAMCALFAAGADAAAADGTTPHSASVDFTLPPRGLAQVAVASPSPYQSRAPPPTL